MRTLDETSCAKGKPLRTLWTADEARLVKRILNNLTVKQWNLPSTEVERDLSGDWTIWIPEGGSGGTSTSAYRSYFKVADASTEIGGCIVAVKDGGTYEEPSTVRCGTVIVNGERVDLPYFSQGISEAGTYYIWVQSWISASIGAYAKIIVGDLDTDTAPDDQNGSLAFSNRLIGRIKVEEIGEILTITQITQDFLSGGELIEFIFGNCFGEN